SLLPRLTYICSTLGSVVAALDRLACRRRRPQPWGPYAAGGAASGVLARSLPPTYISVRLRSVGTAVAALAYRRRRPQPRYTLAAGGVQIRRTSRPGGASPLLSRPNR